MADNFHFDLTGVPLETCLDIAFGSYRKLVGWHVEQRGDGPLCGSRQAMQNALVTAKLVEEPPEVDKKKHTVGTTDLSRTLQQVSTSLRRDGWELRAIVKRDPSVPRMVLFWSDFDGKNYMQRLPAPMTATETVPFVKAWLGSANYGHEPDHDGDNTKGWRVYNESWGHIGQWHSAFAAIEPVWLMHGK